MMTELDHLKCEIKENEFEIEHRKKGIRYLEAKNVVLLERIRQMQQAAKLVEEL